MPAVLNASGPISVPRCEAPISMGTPSKATRGFLGMPISDMRYTFKDRMVGKAERAHHTRSRFGWMVGTVQKARCPPPSSVMFLGDPNRSEAGMFPQALKYAI